MSEGSSITNSPQIRNSFTSNRLSTDGTINLNDDLAVESEYSSSSFLSHQGKSTHKRSGSAISFRTSVDADSSFLSSAYFPIFNQSNQEEKQGIPKDEFSPLGPNSIYELTFASDLARSRRSRTPKTSVTINGGLTSVHNLIAPSKLDIPQVQLLKLTKKVKNEDLESHLYREVAQEYKKFELSYKQLTEDTLQKLAQQDSSFKREIDGFSSSSLSSLHDNRDVDVLDMSAIPEVFRNDDFRLDDPRVFKQVIEGCELLPGNSKNDEETTMFLNNTDIQEKLSQYLVIVEINLVKAIENSSEEFFSTIGDIEEVQKQSKSCIDQFNIVSQRLEQLQDMKSKKGLAILKKLNERKKAEQLESSLMQIQYITTLFELAKKSFANKNFSRCLNEIVMVENLIVGVDYNQLLDEETRKCYPKFKLPIIDISALPALVHMRNDLENLKSETAKGYVSDFADLLLDDLRSHYKNVPIQDTMNRIYVAASKNRNKNAEILNMSYKIMDANTKEKLNHFVENLAKSGHLISAYSSYQDKIIIEIKNIIKEKLPETGRALVDSSSAPSRSSSVPPETNSGQNHVSTSNSLSFTIRSLTPNEFEEMLRSIYASLSECLRHLTIQQKVLLDFALKVIPPAQSQQVDVMSLDITVAINKAIELTQIRLTKVINVRLEQIADLNFEYYSRFYSLSSAYLYECEMINPGYVASGGGNSLNEWMKHHVNYFVHRFHLNSLKSIATYCDKETWEKVTDLKALSTDQNIIDEISSYSEFIQSKGAHGDSCDNWLKSCDLYKENDESAVPESEVITKNRNGKITVENESFIIPSLVSKSLIQMKQYLSIGKLFPNTLSLIEHNILSFYKLMNSKTAQAVLNAGATRTAGLEHIKTRHLALCIQFIDLNIVILGITENIFKQSRSASPPIQGKEPLTFERIIGYYKDHDNELTSKLVSIMYDRTVGHCNAISSIDWSQPLKSSQQCHPYMDVLVKETTTVTKVLSRYLPELKCAMILLKIFDNYKKLLVECFCTKLPQFKDFNEKHSVLKDIDYFRVKLCELPGYGNSGQVIWENVNSLPTFEDTKMEEIMRNNIEGERKKKIEQEKLEQEDHDMKSSQDVMSDHEPKSLSPKARPNDQSQADKNESLESSDLKVDEKETSSLIKDKDEKELEALTANSLKEEDKDSSTLDEDDEETGKSQELKKDNSESIDKGKESDTPANTSEPDPESLSEPERIPKPDSSKT
ncbi:uncharacterized protein PRCAT00004960001 [Priceomyces carsonii]|uniref:uncharacterized protein n=1 Tax=Priceomyces carsonii TaxID=28549 RepID=UPI002ED79897|nr:unnamed protein product [Priceomyces carsonii]